mmetsp:Transcript_77309/g.121745  ORF Transcript_77309/g.121745 Transcript_77309/m.121745 type:complete len:148 (+) Transcript_77309:44-487(+)
MTWSATKAPRGVPGNFEDALQEHIFWCNVVDKEASYLRNLMDPLDVAGKEVKNRRASSHSKPVEKCPGRRRPPGTLPSIARDLNAKGWPSLNPNPLRSSRSMARTMSEPMLLNRGDKPKDLPSLGSMKSSEQKLRRPSAWLDGSMKV